MLRSFSKEICVCVSVQPQTHMHVIISAAYLITANFKIRMFEAGLSKSVLLWNELPTVHITPGG